MLNTLYQISLFCLLGFINGYSQTGQNPCIYLAYEGFDYNTGSPIQGQSGGTGWQFPWLVQNEDITIPGFQNIQNSIIFDELVSIGNRGSGGRAYLTMGRRLQTAPSGPFSNYVASNENGIGTSRGDTLWYSVLLNKPIANDQEVYTVLHNDNLPYYHNSPGNQQIGVGYFGTESNVSGQRRWSLRLGNNYYHTSLTTNNTVFIVLRIIFGASDTDVALFINPTQLGASGPPMSPIIQQSTGNLNVIRSLSVYLGNDPGNGHLDEVRFASSYACVAPDSETVINLPPVSIFTMSAQSGQSPLNINFNADNSYDPENGEISYSWNFGDGSPAQTGINPSHTFDALGIFNVSLSVTDNLGLSHVSYQTITVLDENNTFPCQTTVTCLQMSSCQTANGIIRVNAGNNNFQLRNENNIVIPPSFNNEFHQLAVGTYFLTVAGNNSVCSDTFEIFMRTDSTTCQNWQPEICAMELGTNMSSFADWSFERPMKNLFKHIRNQILTFSDTSTCWDCEVGNQLNLDSNGYPIGIPQTTSIGTTMVRYILSAEGGNLRQDSIYILLYDGTGTITLNGGLEQLSSGPGRIVFRPLNNGNIWIHILFSDSNNHIRNFRLVRPQHEFSDLINDPFYEPFIDKISPFNLLRFMDWGETNNSPLVSWSDRNHTANFTYSGHGGVPYEIMIQLANFTEQDIWICVPHQADDDFVMQMATLFKNNLNSKSKIYLEYSNEVWNWIFQQAHYNDNNRPMNLSYGRAMAEKARRIFRIWHEVFAGQECRVKRVLGIQAGFNGLNEQILSQIPQDEWDFGSPTHYFGLDHSPQANPELTGSSTVQDVMLNAQNSWNSFKSTVKRDYNNIHVFGKEVITYEGGQHFVGNAFGGTYPYQNAMYAAQYSPEMYNMYRNMLDTIRSWDCKLATNFSLAGVQESIFGSWGVLNDIDQTPPFQNTSPKYQIHLDQALTQECNRRINWRGEKSTLWSDPCNWDKSRVPDQNSDVIIGGATVHQPEVDIHAYSKSVNVLINAVLTVLGGFTLEVLNE
ncbi:MAG: PKD domain-containing protein [Saprospiraceae bacterium]|nr:PKD domain-containing protein [Saprospiraceae bacterium]